MFPSQSIQFAQGAQSMKFSMGPLGPQVMAQVKSFSDADAFEDLLKADAQPHSLVQADVALDNANNHKHKKHASEEPLQACASTIMQMDISKSMFLVGDIFMRKFYTVFDRDNDRVGLAEATRV
mmetsp:Transcript_19423/g.33040  ORF Transcript_19423/g.33040 Transcript_19423/m.33040 type:complete len:124 (-) Transcript_19423:49-420(-)